jgi:hypothetical protein
MSFVFIDFMKNYIFIAFCAFVLLCPTFQSCGSGISRGILTSNGTTVTPRRNFLRGTPIDLIIFDLRADKHQGMNLERTIQEHIVKSYPNAWVRYRDRDAFFKDPKPGVVTLKIKIQEYDVTERYLNTPNIPTGYSTQTNKGIEGDTVKVYVNKNKQYNPTGAPYGGEALASKSQNQYPNNNNNGYPNYPNSNNGSYNPYNASNANAVMVMLAGVYDRRAGGFTNNANITEAQAVAIQPNGGYSNDGLRIVLQRSLERVCNFIDGTLGR